MSGRVAPQNPHTILKPHEEDPVMSRHYGRMRLQIQPRCAVMFSKRDPTSTPDFCAQRFRDQG